jgi:flagellar biosynthesis protein FlhA
VNSEVIVACSVLVILFVMVIPVPPFLLDLLLSVDITIGLAVLLTAFYALRPLDLAIFPGLLLMTTLLRLSLNVASTRLILADAEAGALIESFGSFVVSGNYVVGGIIFLVLVIINFVVITKGSSRIAEVAARFTLDAMPGKQMAIDADLNAGLIDDLEAKQRREDIAREADFYGAMDGASKFVRGDAIAGLLILAINVIGGLLIGVGQHGMSFQESAHTFIILSIGDGLVSQIPSLLISTAAGIIVSRASGESNLANDLQAQLFSKPTPLFLTGGFLAMIGLVPGMPIFPFFLLAGTMLLAGGHRRDTIEKKEAQERALEEAQAAEEADQGPDPQELVMVDPLELEIGYSLISLVDPEQGGDLLERIRTLRKQLALEMGMVIQPIRIRDNVGLDSNKYIIKLRNNPIGEGEVLPGYHLALLPDDLEEAPPGIRTTDPTFGMPAVWIAERSLSEAEQMGLTVVEAPAVITTHLLEVLRKHAYKLLTRQEVQKLLDQVREEAPALVDELVPEPLGLGPIQKVLKNLLREQIPIRDLITIFETLADQAQNTRNEDVLTEHVRGALAPTVTRQFADENNTIYTFVLDPMLEQHLLELTEKGEMNPTTLGLQPERSELFAQTAEDISQQMISQGRSPVLLTSPVLRPTLYRFLYPVVSDISVLSYNDLTQDASIEVVDQLQLP